MPIIQLSLFNDDDSETNSMIKENSSIRLRCQIRANPYPTKAAIWFFNSTRIDESNDRKLTFINHNSFIQFVHRIHHSG